MDGHERTPLFDTNSDHVCSESPGLNKFDCIHICPNSDLPATSASFPPASKWQFWRITSPSNRFFLLILISIIPFGGHFVKNGMSSLEQFMLDDSSYPLTSTMYGALIAAVSIPNMVLPFLGGRFLDKHGPQKVRLFLLWTCIGQVIFSLGMQFKKFWMAILGRILFGIGEGSVVVGTRVLIASWFRGEELTFAMGVGVAITNLSKMLSKATVAPIAIYFQGYVQALWYGFGVCLVSVFVDMIVYGYTKRIRYMVKCFALEDLPIDSQSLWVQNLVRQERQMYQRSPEAKPSSNLIEKGVDAKEQKLYGEQEADLRYGTDTQSRGYTRGSVHRFGCRGRGYRHGRSQRVPYIINPVLKFGRFPSLPSVFWTLVILHVVFINVFHLFQNVSSSYLYQRYHYSMVKSGFISSLSHSMVMFAPLIGYLIGQDGQRIAWIFLACTLAILSYGLLLFTDISPIVSMVLMSICLSFTPTILMAAIPVSVSTCRLGVAFGIVEVTDAIGAALGNLVIGYVRDFTGSYHADMIILFILAWLTLLLTFVLYCKGPFGGCKAATAAEKSNSATLCATKPCRSRAFSMDDDCSAQTAALNAAMALHEQNECRDRCRGI
uniref:Lysosomal dipeptide transporter MFSD1 n=1 Tax=Albugo laibachii Nc14 TaxID=890382 RepID=F0WUC4_9STRA|nr:Major Facilitator Superfamily (MFS) putative [Albugo laibachii Nc14]|eukprot:CCA25002.1 Major Facilitator Superfamily (MFS) putative [Albugo laibachii Nc14]